MIIKYYNSLVLNLSLVLLFLFPAFLKSFHYHSSNHSFKYDYKCHVYSKLKYCIICDYLNHTNTLFCIANKQEPRFWMLIANYNIFYYLQVENKNKIYRIRAPPLLLLNKILIN